MRSLLLVFLFTFLFMTAFGQAGNDFFLEGKKNLNNKKYAQAIKSFSKAIEANEKNETYYYYRGVASVRDMKYNDAYSDFNQAIKLKPDYTEAFVQRSRLFNPLTDARRALNDLDMAIKYAREDSIRYTAKLERSSLELTTRNFEGAVEDCLDYLTYDSLSRNAMVNLAMSKGELNQEDEGLMYLHKILKTYPMDTMVIMNIGFLNLKKERYDSACFYLQKAVNMDEKNAYGYSNLAYVKMKMNDLKGALKDVNKSLNLNPYNSYAYRNRALIYLCMKEKEKACIDFNAAVKQGFTEQYGYEVRDSIDTNCLKK